MAVAFLMVVRSLPEGVGFSDALAVAKAGSASCTIETGKFDPNDRYNLWSGLIGGFFLQLAYFGTDQSQVGRYLTRGSRSPSLGADRERRAQRSRCSSDPAARRDGVRRVPPVRARAGVLPAARARSSRAARIAAVERDRRGAAVWGRRRRRRGRSCGGRDDGAAGATQAVPAQARMGGRARTVVALLKRTGPARRRTTRTTVFLEFVLKFCPRDSSGSCSPALFAASMN